MRSNQITLSLTVSYARYSHVATQGEMIPDDCDLCKNTVFLTEELLDTFVEDFAFVKEKRTTLIFDALQNGKTYLRAYGSSHKIDVEDLMCLFIFCTKFSDFHFLLRSEI